MNLELLKDNYFKKVVSIIETHEQKLNENGSRFNIFSILNISSNEVRLHSSFIAELLRSNGTHGFKNEFCKQFIAQLISFDKNNIISDFNFEKYEVEVEKPTGLINENYTFGGRIDIVITDNEKRRIIIENKLFASDQKNQLLRYYNFDKKAILLYLTLNGSEPSSWSTNNEIKKNEDFYCISYNSFIKEWIGKCVEIAEIKKVPKVSETISQYLDVINEYTNNKIESKMRSEIINLIANNEDFYNSIEEIFNSYNSFREEVKKKFWQQIMEKRPNQTILITENQIEIKLDIDEDKDGFYFGFITEYKGLRIKGTDTLVSSISNCLKEINANFSTNENYVGWIYSNYFKKFWGMSKEKIFKLNDETEMNEFTDEIVNEVNQYIIEIEKRIKN